MQTSGRGDVGRQKAGGWAALYLALAYLVAMPFYLVAVDYLSAPDAAGRVAVLVADQGSMAAMNLISYVVFGVVLAGLALALHDRLKDGMPATMQVATAVAFIWAVVLVASGLIFNAGMAAVAELYGSDPAQAVATWQVIQPVAEGLGGAGGEILGGSWLLLVSWAALRTGGLPRPLSVLGLGVGAAGLLSVIPPLRDAAYVFGLLQMVWFVWLGIVMMRPTRHGARQSVRASGPAQASEFAGSRC